MKFKDNNLKITPFIPNFITIISLCSGLTSIRLAFEGNFERAVVLILIASVMDFLDGKTARLLKVKSKLGEYLDSLADMVSFGVAPMFLVYHFALSSHKKLGWTACLFFSVCMALRLARFNAMLSNDPLEKKFSIGVPAPMGAFIIVIPLFFFLETDFLLFQNFIINFIFVWAAGFLMVSKIPVFMLKKFSFSKLHNRFFVITFLSGLPFFYTHPYFMLGLLGVISISSIPISYNYYKKNL